MSDPRCTGCGSLFHLVDDRMECAMKRIERLERVAEAAREVPVYSCHEQCIRLGAEECDWCALQVALRALDGVPRE